MVERLTNDQIISQINRARTDFTAYINSLVGDATGTRLISSEMDLFNLENIYNDNRVDANEVSPFLNRLSGITNSLVNNMVNTEQVVFNERLGKLVLSADANINIDFNRDAVLNDADRQIFEYVINFQDSVSSALDNALRIAGDERATAQYEIHKAAEEAGFVEGTSGHTAYYNYFYGLFSRTTNPVVLNDIKVLFELNKRGVGRTNYAELDDYAPMVQARVSFNTMMQLYLFKNSPAFDATNPTTAFNDYRTILMSTNTNQKELIVQALQTGRIPYTNEVLTARRLTDILTAFASRDSAAAFQIKQMLSERNIIDNPTDNNDDYTLLYNKLYNVFYVADDKGLTVPDISFLMSIYDKFKTDNRTSTMQERLNYLAPYATGLKGQKISYKDLNALYRFETSNRFDYENLPAPNNTIIGALNFMITGLQSNNAMERDSFSQVLRSQTLPITNADLTLSGLFAMRSSLRNEAGMAELQIRTWAQERGFDTTSEFYTGLLGFYGTEQTGVGLKGIAWLLRFYDDNHIQTMAELAPYARALRNNVPTTVMNNIFKFDTTGAFNLTGNARIAKLNQYFDVFITGSNNKKTALAKAFATNKSPGTDNPLTREDLDDFLSHTANDTALDTYMIDKILLERNLSTTDPLYVKIMSFKTADRLDLQQLQTILYIYDLGGLEPNDLDLYKDLVKNKVSLKTIRNIQSFATDRSMGADSNILNSIKTVFLSGTNEQKSLVGTALSRKKIPFTDQDLRADRLFDLINNTTTADRTLLYQIDAISAERRSIPALRDKLLEMKAANVNAIGISQFVSLLDRGDLNLTKLEPYKRLIVAKVDFKTIGRLYNFEISDKFNVSGANRNSVVDSFANVLINGYQEQKNILIGSFRNTNIPYTNQPVTATALNDLLPTINTEERYNRFRIDQMARTADINVGSSEHTAFVANFYTKFLVAQRLDLQQVQTLVDLYKTGSYTYSDGFLDRYANAMKNVNVQGGILIRFHSMSEQLNLSPQNKLRYLRYLDGTSTESNIEIKRQFLIKALRKNYIPFTNRPLVTRFI